MNDPTIVRFSLAEQRTERMTGLVTPATRADWEIVKKRSPRRQNKQLSIGDLITLSVELLKNHPKLFDEDYELREKE